MVAQDYHFDVLAMLDANDALMGHTSTLTELTELLKIPSISTLSENKSGN